MQVAIARDYFPAYARLPRKAQNKADDFLRKFAADPRQASIHYEPIRGAQDKQLRSVRIGDDYRAIVRAPERGDAFLLLWVDHHDEAYRWASSKRTAVHPATGTLQLFDLDAAAQVVTSLGAEPQEKGSIRAATAAWLKAVAWSKPDGEGESGVPRDTDRGSKRQKDEPPRGGPVAKLRGSDLAESGAPAEGPSSGGEGDGPRLFAAFSDDELFQGGVPRVLIPAVRAVASEDELDQLAPHLPAEAAEILTGLVAGFTLDTLLEELVGRAAPKAPETKPLVDPADVAAALERPSSQQQFRVVGADFDLESALAHPLDVWRVYLHPKQRVLARSRTKGPMRVTGGAGTGKTVVALHRAAFLVREVFPRPDDRVLFTTFTVNLAFDLRRQLEKLLEPHELARVDVRNIDGWAADHLRSRGEQVRLATNDAQEQAWARVMDIYAVEGFGLEFCRTEWRDVIQAQDLRDEEAYVRAVRLARGLPLGRRERRLLWPLFRAYRQELEGSGFLEAVEILRKARQRVESEGGSGRYRAVVVDETQDFSLEALRLVRALAGAEHPDDLFLVGDAHQRIYGRPVTLGSAGINVRGRRSQELRLNYRTTAAICRWSLGALGREEVDDLDEGKASRRGYVSLREGQPPSVRGFEHGAEEVGFVVGEVKRLIAGGTPPEGICIAARRAFALRDRFQDALVREGIAADVIDREEPRHPSVRLATMHRIKGLEFPVVFVVGVNADEVPFQSEELASEDAVVAHRAEVAERCLLYVAASRARDALFVTWAGEPSPFLAAMGSPPAAVVTTARAARSVAPGPIVTAAPVVSPEVVSPEVVSSEVVSPEVVSVPSSEGVFEAALATSLDALELPTRLANWATNKGLETLGDLVSIPPRDLLAERNMGRKSIFDARKIIEEKLGCLWEEAAARLARADAGGPEMRDPEAPLSSGASTGADPFATADWDVVRKSLPDWLRATALGEIDLPKRVRGYVRAEKLETVAELATRSKADLLAAKNVGRASCPQLVEALRAHEGRMDAARHRAEAGLLESWKALLQEQEAVRRMVLTRRAGFGARGETLQSIGDMLGISRERARQLEAGVLQDLGRERAWLDEIRRRLDTALGEAGAVPLESLAADPWWAAAARLPDALDYFGDRILGGAMRVVEVDEHAFLARCAQADFDALGSELRERAGEVPLPSVLSAFRALADELTPKIGSYLSGVLFERLRELLHIEEPGERVVGFGSTNAAAVLAMLRAAPAPVRVEDLYARMGRFHMPEEVLFFGPGLVGLEHHFPDFREWIERVTPPVLEAMEREAADRQWIATELIEEVREAVELPEWLGHWHLAALLRRSGRVRYLGRNRFVLLDAQDERGRIHYHDELARILRSHGAPMRREDLVAEIRKKTSISESALGMHFTRPPFLRYDADRMGLLDRDLPGGGAALADALEHVASVLEHRQRGLGAAQLTAQVTRLSPEHAQWTEEMCLSVVRGDPRFRLSQSGALGLSAWESVRVPTRLEIVRQCLEESDWHVTVEAVQRRIEAYYGVSIDRIRVGALANRFGVVLRGEWLERQAGEGSSA